MVTRSGARGPRLLPAIVAALALALPAAAVAAPSWAPGRVLVGARDGTSAAALASRLGGEVVVAPRAGVVMVDTRDGETVPEAVARLRGADDVAWAEPDRVVTQEAVPNDPFAGEETWFHNVGQVNGGRVAGLPGADAAVPDAWDVSRGSAAAVVAVVDGGVAYDNADLAPAMWTNPGETGGGRETNGVDDDHDGFVDDWRGWDFRDDDADPRDLGLLPHGTAVAGIIGARADDGVGIAGVAPLSRIMPLRVTGPDGTANVSDVIAAFGYAARMGARVVNASFGGTVASNAERAAIAAAPGVLFVASAGNDGANLDGSADSYPCEFDLPNVICVAATDEHDALPAFSNRGARTVDLAAPGVGVLTTTPPFAPLLTEGFETPLAGRWTVTGAWTGTAGRAWSGGWSLIDGPASSLSGSDDAVRSVVPVDLRNRTGCRLDVEVRGGTGSLTVETSTDGGGSWTARGTLPTGMSEWTPADADLTAVQGRSAVLVGLRARPAGGGAEVDDLQLRCLGGAPGPRDLIYASGTSFAAPVVAGIAALLIGARPSATVAEVRTAILAGVDRLPSLDGQVATGGRASARGALDAFMPRAAATVVATG
ncbi:MAG TPA: S8 family serine peptidase, partial [Miltoncostaea sp.]|nr:S8 family serine peptidase [Miltoncostaea sp.]